ncbi:tetratricopeptide repeat protein [Bradymonas sediminis]|uniref:tetratricopeptide repeat protein n=1 Tax=Bradymonas sediminis TaxID=1548548 RepID=UPI0010612C73|nr:tetratricopeptide repeat protein [Bradymonas sediminis]TDP76038.1 Tfp pilus assembly protein PilF [Bradymonas sediminis]
MNFEQRALRARQSGDAVRAAVLLIEGLKRHPGEQTALALLCEIYIDDIDSSGLEYELSRVLVAQPDAEAYFAQVLDALRERQKMTMGRELIRAAGAEGLKVTWPPPRVVLPPEPEPEPEALAEPEPPGAPASTLEPADAGAAPDVTEHEKLTPLDDDELPASATHPREESFADFARLSPEAPARETDPSAATITANRPRTPDKAKPQPRRRKNVFVLIVLLLCVGGGALLWWKAAPPSLGVGALDSAIEMSDPALKASSTAIFGEAGANSKDERVSERRAFVAAVYAADWGEASAAVSTRETAWGLATSATSWALRGEFEKALSESARLERQYPGALPTHWARGFVAESRGQFAEALSHYLAGQAQYPKFAPFLSAQLRIALRQARPAQAQKLQDALGALSPDNPYNHLEIKLPTLSDFEGGTSEDAEETKSGVLPVARPQFVLAMQHLEQALNATRKGDWPGAREAAEASLKADAELGPALLVAAILRAGDLDISRADAAWARLAKTPGLSEDYRWFLQIAAPRSFSAAGRPDLGYKYAVQLKALGKVDPRELTEFNKALAPSKVGKKKAEGARSVAPKVTGLPESVMPLLSVENQLQDQPLAAEAILARAEVLTQLGLTRAAAESLELLDGVPDAQEKRAQMRVSIAIRDGELRQARALAASIKYSPLGDGARAQVAYYSGNYEDAIVLAGRALEHTQSVDISRALVLSHLSLGHGRLAGSLLTATPVAPLQRGAFRALTMRVERGGLANNVETHRADDAIFEGFLAVEPTSVERLVDLANHAFWRKDFKQARGLAEQALRLADSDPAAHWVMGLVEHISSQESAADRHFRAAWRRDPSDPLLLIEMGRIYLGMGKAKSAQGAFYRALLRDRRSTVALNGLGSAYLEFSRRTGVRDLSRILEGYQGESQYLAQSVETLRWLAILSGARDGKEAGHEYLQQAVALIGESADLLIELAQFHAARGETEEARKLFARVLEKDSTRADARIGLARMALKAGDKTKAAAQLRRYLRFAPAGEDAEWARETLERLQGEGGEKGDEHGTPSPATDDPPAPE